MEDVDHKNDDKKVESDILLKISSRQYNYLQIILKSMYYEFVMDFNTNVHLVHIKASSAIPMFLSSMLRTLITMRPSGDVAR